MEIFQIITVIIGCGVTYFAMTYDNKNEQQSRPRDVMGRFARD